MIPLHQRVIPVGATAIVLRANEPTLTGAVVSSADTTHFVLPVGASAIDNFYNGLFWHFKSGVGAGQGGFVKDYDGASRAIETIDAMTTQPTTATTVSLGPGLPPAFSQLLIGGGTVDIKYSFRVGGTAATDYMSLTGGLWRTIDAPAGMRVLEILGSGTGTVNIEWV